MRFFSPRACKFYGTIAGILLACSSAWGQAKVNENLETASIYVDVKVGSDSNPGTQTAPFKTIGAAAAAAINNNHNGIGTSVIINPGTYRESIAIGKGSRTTSAPITFQAAKSGTVTVSGADVWRNWTVSSDNAGVFTHSWQYQWGVCPGDPAAPTEQEIILRREMIFVGGTPLTQVLSQTAMQPGTFFVDEANSVVYAWPPAGVDLTNTSNMVEVSTRPTLFTDSGQSEVVLRGMNFQYANSCRQSTAAVTIVSGAHNVMLDTVNLLWNNAIGVTINGAVENFTIKNTVASHNGQLGFNTSQVKSGLWQNDTTSYNNWRGAQGAFYSWDTGGTKFLLDHNGTFTNLTTMYNQAHGIAFDTDNKGVTLNSLVSLGNVGTGFYAEKSEGPFTFSGASVCENNVVVNPYLGGITLRDSAAVSLATSTLYGNGTTQIELTGQPGGFEIPDWETGQIYNLVNENLSMSSTTLAGPSNYQVFNDGALGGSDWQRFTSTLTSDNNTFWAGSNGGAFTVPMPKTWTDVNLGGWRSATGQDSHSTWASAAAPAACNIASQGADYWLLMMTNTAHPITLSPTGTATWNVATMPMGGMTGTVNLSLDGLSVIPGATAAFSPASVPVSGASTLTLTTAPGTPAGTYPFTIIANSGNVTHTMTISVAVPQSSIRISTSSLTFAAQKIGTSSAPQQIVLTNTGKNSLSIGKISSSGIFSATNNCGGAIKAGQSCNINVTFSPHAVGPVSQRITITDADQTSPQAIAVSGTGLASPKVRVSPTFIGFGPHKIGTSTTKTVTLENDGTGALTISSMAISGTGSKNYSQTSNCGGTLAAAQTCTVTVTFNPQSKATLPATLSIYDNDAFSASPQTVGMSGGGQ